MTILLLMLATLVKAQDTIAVDRPLPWNGREVDKAKLAKQIEKNDVDSTKAPNHIGSGTTDGNTLTIFDENTKNLAKKENKPSVEKGVWMPKPKKALWYAIALPGAGQIYNRKYWKLPIFYGGFLGCAYAMRWNNQMYADYAQAYIDIMDDNPNTNSFNQFLHLGSQITDQNIDRYKELFRKRKDRFRRWRDLSFFCMIGVYGLSIIDAYVDASLSQFDISDDLSLRLEPGFVNSDGKAVGNRNKGGFGFSSTTGVGINAALTF